MYVEIKFVLPSNLTLLLLLSFDNVPGLDIMAGGCKVGKCVSQNGFFENWFKLAKTKFLLKLLFTEFVWQV